MDRQYHVTLCIQAIDRHDADHQAEGIADVLQDDATLVGVSRCDDEEGGR